MAAPPAEPIPIADIRAAAGRIAGSVLHSPLIRLNLDSTPTEIYLKLENLQPIGSFKLRGAGNAIATAPPDQLAKGVYTASAGNMAQGVAWHARRLGIPCTVIVPDHAPRAKLTAIERLGARIIAIPFDAWWQVLLDRAYPGMDGLFIHPVSDPAVLAGNGTIGLEILDDLPSVETVLVPYGGGGLSCGIASAMRALKPSVSVYGCEVATAAPFAASLAAGSPREVPYTPSFVDGIGSKSVLPEMWPLAGSLLAGSLVVTLDEVMAAVRLLVERNRVVAEGAGATSVAAALSGQVRAGPVVCIISGGNIDAGKLAHILAGEEP
ncbi:MAG TPA: threonine/serine dehydratase [Chloroflexota bacterium]|nr:threonine/serine dehydratase [Chloroflexota bacterium]